MFVFQIEVRVNSPIKLFVFLVSVSATPEDQKETTAR